MGQVGSSFLKIEIHAKLKIFLKAAYRRPVIAAQGITAVFDFYRYETEVWTPFLINFRLVWYTGLIYLRAPPTRVKMISALRLS